MAETRSDGSPIRQRTRDEKAAYIDGFDAGVKAVERELERDLSRGEAVAVAKASAELVRSTLAALPDADAS